MVEVSPTRDPGQLRLCPLQPVLSEAAVGVDLHAPGGEEEREDAGVKTRLRGCSKLQGGWGRREAGGEERLAGRVESPQWSLIVHTLVSESEIIQGPTQVITS